MVHILFAHLNTQKSFIIKVSVELEYFKLFKYKMKTILLLHAN